MTSQKQQILAESQIRSKRLKSGLSRVTKYPEYYMQTAENTVA